MKVHRVVIAVIMLMVAFSGINGVAFANSNVNLVLDSYSVDVCAYNTKMITGYVENTGGKEEEVKIYANTKWITIAQDSLVLAPGERKYITLFLTPTDEAKTGTYYAKIYASTLTAEDVESLAINIMDCSDIKIDVRDTTINACIGDNLKIPFYIENLAKTTEFVDIGSDKGRLEFYQTQLDAYESDKNYLYFKVTKDYEAVKIFATSKNSFAKDEVKIYINGENCYDFDMTVVPQSTDICMSEYGVFDVYVRNTGSSTNTINIKTSYGVLSDNAITLEPGEERVVKLKVMAEKEGEKAIRVEAFDKVNYQFRDLQITGKRCSDNAIIVVPQNMEVCKGSAARYVVGVRNLGEVREELELTTSMGELDTTSMVLNPGEIKYVELYINSDNLDYNNYTIDINLTKKGKVIDTLKVKLGVKNCYNGDIYTPYKEVKACKFTPSKPVDVFITNTGERRETYYLGGNYGYFVPNTITLEPLEEKVVKYVVNITEDVAEGVIQDTLLLRGENMKSEKAIRLNIDVLKENMCSNFSVSVEPLRIDAMEYKGYIYKIRIKNNGYAPNTFKVLMDEDYGMVYIEPKSISLDAMEEGIVFMYVAPTSKMPNKIYELKGRVMDKFKNEKQFTVEFNLQAYKEEFVPYESEDKIRVRALNIDAEKIYYVSESNITTMQIEYIMEGRKEVEEILFGVGSFIIQIGDELYEDKNPKIGKKTYTIYANNKTYIIDIKFVHVDNENKEYKFKVENIIIEKEKKLFELKEREEWSVSWKIVIPLLLVLIGVIAIVYDYRRKNGKGTKRKKRNGKRRKEIKELKKAIEE